MRRYAAAWLLFALVPAWGWGEVTLEIHGGGKKIVQVDKVVVIKEDRTVVTSFPFTITAKPGAAIYTWSLPSNVTALDKGDRLEVTNAPKGDLTFGLKVVTVDWDARKFTTDFGQITFSVGDVGPQPPGPLPPGPQPPGPTPPGPAPIPATGLRVLFVFETKDLTKYSPQQKSILYGDTVRSYLQKKCAMGPDGSTVEARYFDQNQNVAHESKIWQDAMKRPRGQIPWILISTGSEGFEGPLPATVEETMTLLRRYGGQ